MIEKTTWFQLQPLYRYLRQQTENKKFYKYLEIGATFSLIAIFLFTAITPTATAISNLVGEIKSKEIITKKMKAKISSIILAQDNYSLLQEKYQILESSFPSRPNFYKSALAYSSISKETNTSIAGINFNLSEDNNEKTDNKLDSYNVNLTVSGQYNLLLNTIKKITDNRRLTKIKSIQIGQLGDKDSSIDTNSINLNLSTELFYLPITSNEQK